MTPAERKAVEWITANPAWMLGYIGSLERQINAHRAACSLPPLPMFPDRVKENQA